MIKTARNIFDIREGELKVTLLMLFNIYLLLLTFYFLKPARDSLFLVELGADQLPYVFILTAIVIIPVTTLYSKASSAIKLNRLITYTLVILIFCLFGLRYLMREPTNWVPYMFYAWVSVYGALTTSQFWLLANQIYTASQAKRLFPLLGLGGIFGAFSGGEITNMLIEYLGISTENMLLFCIGFLLISIVIIKLIWNEKQTEIASLYRKSKSEAKPKVSFIHTFGSIIKTRHLRLIVIILSLTMIVGSLIDFQFKAITTSSFTDPLSQEVDKSGLTAFLGTFYGRLSLFSILIQLFFSGKIIQKFGVGSVILLLPIGLLLGSVGLFAYTILISAVILRGTGEALENSIDKTGRELLFLPVSSELKKRTKLFIDLFVDRVARGIAGFLLLFFIYIFEFDKNPTSALKSMSLVVIGLLLVWIVTALMMRREYVNTFRKAIYNRELNLAEIRQQINESSSINILIASLHSKNTREINYALDMLEDVENNLLIEPLTNLTAHSSDIIATKALKLLKPYYSKLDLNLIENFIASKNPQKRIQALHLLILKNPDKSHEIIKSYLEHEKQENQLTALCLLAEYGSDEQKTAITEAMLSSLVRHFYQDSNNLQHLIRAIGKLEIPEYIKFIHQMLDHPDEKVVNQAIKGIRYLKDIECTDWLMTALLDHRYRVEARNALASFGPVILYRLKDELVKEINYYQYYREVPRVISMIHDQSSIDLLVELITLVPENFSRHCLKGLSKLRQNCPDLNYYPKKIDQLILSKARMYYTYMYILDQQNFADNQIHTLFVRAIEDRLRSILEQIFRLIGLNHPAKDIYNAYQSVVSGNANLQASAVEFLDNILESDLKKCLLPILDEQNRIRIISYGKEMFNLKPLDNEGLLLQLIEGNELWLKTIAIYLAKDFKTEPITKAVSKMRNDKIEVVRETVELYLKEVAS